MRNHDSELRRNLSAYFSADPDDAFAWWGILERRIECSGLHFNAVAGNVNGNNQLCRNEVPDVAAISSASYPDLAGNYAVLSSGASVGRGYGPALIAREGVSLESALSGPVAVAGAATTGGTLLRVLFPQAQVVEMPWKEIPGAVASGRVCAGVAIHESLLLWRSIGLRRVACLGECWQKRTGLPLPVGLVVAHRRLGREILGAISDTLRRSVEEALLHRQEAMDYAAQYSLTPDRAVMERFVDCFANSDTVQLPLDARDGLNEFLRRMEDMGLCARKPSVEFVFSHAVGAMSA